MNQRIVDVAIIGTGTAGMGAYREASKYTDSIVLIEGGEYGTTCARVGCMPSKLLIAASEVAHHVKSADTFGINVGQVVVDDSAVLDRVKSERDRFVNFVVEDVEGFKEEHKVRGFARFKDSHTLLVDDHTEIIAKRIVIATGSRPFIPSVLHGAEDRLLVNDDVFELDKLPESVFVVGTGVIGLELGQALSRLGVNVTMLGRGNTFAGISDQSIKNYAADTFRDEFALHLDGELVEVKRTQQGVKVRFLGDDGEKNEVDVDYVLAAAGRIPNVDRLDIDRIALERGERGIPVYDSETMQTSISHIFIAGDATSDRTLLHEAADEGRIAGRNAARYPAIEKGQRRAHLGVVFSDPQISSIGLQSHDLVDIDHVVGEVSFEGQGRSRVIGKNRGLLKVYADQVSGVLLGAEMFGPAAEHIGHLLAWAVQQKLTVDDILEMPFYHPVIEEGVRTAFRDASAKLADVRTALGGYNHETVSRAS